MPVDHSPVLPAIPITTVRIGAEAEALVLSVLRSGIIAQGPLVKRLEDEFAELIGVDHVVAVNNGTTALIAALDVLDLQPGDEVITSPFTFVATLNAIIESGATARFADIDAADFNLDPSAVAAAVNERTKVLLPVHLYGQCADMDSLADIASAAGSPSSRTPRRPMVPGSATSPPVAGGSAASRCTPPRTSPPQKAG